MPLQLYSMNTDNYNIVILITKQVNCVNLILNVLNYFDPNILFQFLNRRKILIFYILSLKVLESYGCNNL